MASLGTSFWMMRRRQSGTGMSCPWFAMAGGSPLANIVESITTAGSGYITPVSKAEQTEEAPFYFIPRIQNCVSALDA